MNKPYRIDGAPGSPQHTLISTLIEMGAPEAAIDADQNHLLQGGEAMRFLATTPDWRKYAPGFEKMRVVHPLNPQLPEPIQPRIAELKATVIASVGLSPEAPGFCDAFVPAFFHAGLPSYQAGGLGFGYTPGTDPSEAAEMTAAQSYLAVLDPRYAPGTCSEATYRIITAFAATGVHCPIQAVATQKHLFARYKDQDLDPAGIGTIGWEKVLSEGELWSSFFIQAASKLTERRDIEQLLAIAQTIDPANDEVYFIGSIFVPPAMGLSFLQKAIRLNPQAIHYYDALRTRLQAAPNRAKAQTVALETLAIPGVNPSYALEVLMAQCGDAKACLATAKILAKRFPKSGHAEVIRAMQYFHDKKPEAAIEQLQRATALNPHHGLAWHLLGQEHVRANNFAEAETAIRHSLATAPNLINNHRFLSMIYAAQGRPEAAFSEAQREAIIGPNANAARDLATTAASLRRMDDAYAYAQRYIASQPSDPAGYRSLAQVLLFDGKAEEAVTVLQDLLVAHRKFPKDDAATQIEMAATLKQLAVTHLALGHDEASLAAVTEAAALSTDDADTLLTLGLVHGSRQEYAVAETAIRQAIAIAPQLADAWAQLSLLLVSTNRYAEARAAALEALQRNPTLLAAHFTLLECDDHDGRPEAYQARLTQLRREQATNPDFLWLDTITTVREGDWDRAAPMAHRALQFNPYNQLMRFAAGSVALHDGDLATAETMAAEIGQFNPTYQLGPLLSARVALARGDADIAEIEARRALTFDPYDVGNVPAFSARRTLIDSLRAQGKSEEANVLEAQLTLAP